MYNQFYGLKENPFNVTADPSFLYFSNRHKEAFSHMLYGIRAKKGFLEITGEVGTGKTTLCRALLDQLEDNVKTSFIFNPNLSELQLLQAIVEDFGIVPVKRSKIGLFSLLNDFLLEQLSKGYNVVLIIDEAQNLKPRVLEQIRLLSNLETRKEKLFQIILVGQPELKEKLRSESLRQLRQRIGISYHILPLDLKDIAPYIHHRLKIAGADENDIFSDDAIDEIGKFSQGIPRLINVICDKTLLLGYAISKRHLTAEHVKRSIDEMEGVIK